MTKKLFTALAAASLLAGPALAGDETATRTQSQDSVQAQDRTQAQDRAQSRDRVQAQERAQAQAGTKALKAEAEKAALRHAERHVTRTGAAEGSAVRAGKGAGGPGDAARAAETMRSGEMRGAAPAVPGGAR